MNLITRIILRGVVSGNIPLTPQVLGALKAVSQDCPVAGELANAANASGARPDESSGEASAGERHQSFINPPVGWWKHRTGCVLASALALSAGVAHAEFNPGQFEAAVAAGARGRYPEAARGYESLIAQQGWSAPVLFNLANSQQREGRLGEAILNYERATWLAPGDPDIAANLRLARQKAGLAAEPQSHFANIAQLLTLNGWFCFAAAALFLIAVMLPLGQLLPEMRPALHWGSMPAVFALILAAAAMANRLPDLNRAIVTAPETAAGVSPVTMAQPVFQLRAGEVVSLKQTHGAFALVVNHAGHGGWVKASAVTRVIPVS